MSHDIRMRGFARRSTVDDAIRWLDAHVQRLPEESVPLVAVHGKGDRHLAAEATGTSDPTRLGASPLLRTAAGRVLARAVVSRVDVPAFARAMMDGFAVRAAETLGATPYNRIAFRAIGESLPGRPFAGRVEPGTAVRIMTGTPMPEGADAVLPVELVELAGREIQAQGAVSPGKHVGQVGEDIAAGAEVLPADRLLRPQDIGLLASIGESQVAVVRRPRVRIAVTGDELLPAGSRPSGCRIVDSNGPMLAALVARDGGLPEHPGIVADRPEAILAAMRSEADAVIVSGGSSVGEEDHAPQLLREHGELAIHGIAMRPSSPTGLGRLDGRLVFLLPGNPVSCLCAYDFFAGRAIRALGGRSTDWPYRRATLPLARKAVSTIGRLDYLRVRIAGGAVEPLAVGGASILSSTTRADGFVLIPPDSEGYPPGTNVEVYLYGE